MKQKPDPARASLGSNSLRSYSALVVVPVLLFVVVGWFAPNFVASENVRHDPRGGDFLQEYAGGILFLDKKQNNELYNVDVCRVIQHDQELLGFEWDESRFFPMVYPPFYYAAISPFSRLDYIVAARLWLFLMTAFLIGGLVLLKRKFNVHTGLLLLACLTAPLLLSLTTGQKSSLLFLILAGTFCLLHGKKHFAAGVVFGLIAFKPHLGIPVGLIMLARRDWSFVIGCYFTVCTLIVASLFTGFDVCMDFYAVTMGFSDYVQSGGYHLEQGFSLWSAWQLALGDATMARNATIVSSLIVMGGTIWFIRKVSFASDNQLARGFSAMTIATILVAPHLYGYDLTMLILPAILMTHIAIKQPRHWMNYAPGATMAIVLFGMKPMSTVAEITGIQLGVPLMIFAWVLVLRSLQSDKLPASSESVLGFQPEKEHGRLRLEA